MVTSSEAYISFLESGLRERTYPYGRSLGLEDAATPAPFAGSAYLSHWVAERLAAFYNVKHEALSHNVMLKKVSSRQMDLLAVDDITFRVLFFTCSRPESFKRAWASFLAAKQPKARVIAEIKLDHCDVPASYEVFLQGLRHPFASVVYTKAASRLGLKQSILSSWVPSSNTEYGIFVVRIIPPHLCTH